LGGSILNVRKNTEALSIASKEIGLEVNAEKTKYMVMSRDPKADGQIEGQTDRQTDKTKPIVAFRNFANTPKRKRKVKGKQEMCKYEQSNSSPEGNNILKNIAVWDMRPCSLVKLYRRFEGFVLTSLLSHMHHGVLLTDHTSSYPRKQKLL
jgi:hypothetical protein